MLPPESGWVEYSCEHLPYAAVGGTCVCTA